MFLPIIINGDQMLILCLKILTARIIDVSLGTIKTFYVVKEKRLIASLIAFLETLIWFIVVKEALNNNINSIFIPISYALGFAVGTYAGMFISSKIIKGSFTINIISSKIRKKDINYLKECGFGVTIISNRKCKVHLLLEVDKKRYNTLKKCLDFIDKDAFIIVNDSKVVHNGYFI